jgi:hypothetical protein
MLIFGTIEFLIAVYLFILLGRALDDHKDTLERFKRHLEFDQKMDGLQKKINTK